MQSDKSMTPEHEEHLYRIERLLGNRLAHKYRRGVEEHGGRMWEKYSTLQLVDMALDECVDQLTYLVTLRDLIIREAAAHFETQPNNAALEREESGR